MKSQFVAWGGGGGGGGLCRPPDGKRQNLWNGAAELRLRRCEFLERPDICLSYSENWVLSAVMDAPNLITQSSLRSARLLHGTYILHGNSAHVANAWRKIGLFREKIRLVLIFALLIRIPTHYHKCSEPIHSISLRCLFASTLKVQRSCIQAHLILTNHVIKEFL